MSSPHRPRGAAVETSVSYDAMRSVADARTVRAWAVSRGIEVAGTGGLPRYLLEEFLAEQAEAPEPVGDVVGPHPVVVFCGLAELGSGGSRHFTASGSGFWESVHLSGMSPRQLEPGETRLLTELGYGLTQLVGRWNPRRLDVDELAAKVELWRPRWVAFISRGVAQEACQALGRTDRVELGVQHWHLGGARVFVLPSRSDLRAPRRYRGDEADGLFWWRALASHVQHDRVQPDLRDGESLPL